MFKELPYNPNSNQIFEKLRFLPYAAFLDSCLYSTEQGRYDIITALPYSLIQTHEKLTTVTTPTHSYRTNTNPFQLLKTLLTPSILPTDDIPFPGGALGFFSYDLARQFEPLIPRYRKSLTPDMMIGLYDWAIIVDHIKQKTTLSCCYRHPASQHQLKHVIALLEKPSLCTSESFQLINPLSSQISFSEYKKAFNTIKQYLYNGDCYQVNLSHQLTASCQGSPWQAYQSIKLKNPMPYSAFLNFNDICILCFSPERFINAKNTLITATPIKGTSPRHKDHVNDQQSAFALKNSPKNIAENLMIVDLLRNDLSKVCAVGSVKVPELFRLNSYAGVHHLTSTINGILPNNRHCLDILQACFPGGSITGAPKIRAMQIIDEVESHRRNLYCGTIGYIGFDGNMDTNIAIRTLIHKNNLLHAFTGGAIVIDSDVENEYQESLDKIAVIQLALRDENRF